MRFELKLSQPILPLEFYMSAQNNATAPLFSLMEANFDGLSRGMASEVLTKSLEASKEALKSIRKDGIEYSVVPLDHRAENKVIFSGLVFCGKDIDPNGTGMVAYHTLMLEDSGEPISPLVENINGLQVEVPRFVADAWDEEYVGAVQALIEREFAMGSNVFNTGAQVAPRGFNWDDKAAVYQLVDSCIRADGSCIKHFRPTVQKLNLSRVDRNADSLQIVVNPNDHQLIDAAGQPIRNDISITTSIVPRQKPQASRSLNSSSQPKLFTKVGGYMDVFWAPSAQPHGGYGYPMQTNELPTWKFAPRFVVTNMENMLTTSVAGQLLALVTARSVQENQNWWTAFIPRSRTGGKRIDIRDPGAFNIEGNLGQEAGYGKIVKTDSATFTLQDMGDLLSKLFRPEVHISLTVSRLGSDAWFNEVFVEAAKGNVDAISDIIAGANELTGGTFAKYYNSANNPVIQNGNQAQGHQDCLHGGYYIGEDGKRDIRDIDYLAVMNLKGSNDPMIGAKWTDTFNRVDYPIRLRMASRKRLIDEATGMEMHYTGIHRLVTFTNEFMNALTKAVIECGITTNVSCPNPFADYSTQRAQVDWLARSGITPGASGAFAYTGNNGMAGGYPQQGFFNGPRW